MAINNPMTSSSQWRIPTMGMEQPLARVAQLPAESESQSVLELVAGQAITIARGALETVIAGLLLGGVVVAPVLAVTAIVALIAPMPAGLRHLAPALTFISLIWLALAIFGAHTQVERGKESAENRDELN